jgi:tight adherence protein C
MLMNLATVGVFGVIALVVFLVARAMTGEAELVRADTGSRGKRGGGIRRAGWIARFLAAVIPGERSKLERQIKRAGYYEPSALHHFLASRNFLVIAGLAATGILALDASRNRPAETMPIVITGLVVAVLVFALPRLVLIWKGNRRVGRIENSLPDGLDMIAMAVTGGLPLADALDRVSCEIALSHTELAQEFAAVRQQAELGTLEQALHQFAHRLDTPAVRALTAMVTQTERLGTNVVTAVQEYADGLRRGHRQRAEERASKASVKMLFPLVFCMAPSVFLLLWGPSMLELRSFLLAETGPGGALSQSDVDLRRLNQTTGLRGEGVNQPSGAPAPSVEPRPSSARRGRTVLTRGNSDATRIGTAAGSNRFAPRAATAPVQSTPAR